MDEAEQQRMRKLAERFAKASEKVEGLERQLEAAQARAKEASDRVVEQNVETLRATEDARDARRDIEREKERTRELVELTATQADQVRELRAAAQSVTGSAEGVVGVQQADLDRLHERAEKAEAEVTRLQGIGHRLIAERAEEANRAADLLFEVEKIMEVLGMHRVREERVEAVVNREKLIRGEMDALQTDVRRLQGDLEERQGWANLTQGELDQIAVLVGLAPDTAWGHVRDAVAETVERGETTQNLSAGESHGPTQARADAFGEIATLLGMPGKRARVEHVLAGVETLVEEAKDLRAAALYVEDDIAMAALERVLAAVWPSETVLQGQAALQRVDEAMEAIGDWRRHFVEATATFSSPLARDGLRVRLFELLAEKAAGEDCSEDVLDRLERLAGVSDGG